MSIRIALNHRTEYTYDRLVNLQPHVVRLRPAPHCRTPILSYSLSVQPGKHFLNWQQDPYSNYLARPCFRTSRFSVEVDLVAELTALNPFDFFIESTAENYPFSYDPLLAHELMPYLETPPAGPKLQELIATHRRHKCRTIDCLVEINGDLQRRISYLIRMEPGVQTCEETLTSGSGSCRDTAWLLVQLLRQLGFAARFVSGYLIQLVADVERRLSFWPATRFQTRMPGLRCICRAPGGSVWIPLRGSWQEKDTFRWPVRPIPSRQPRSPGPFCLRPTRPMPTTRAMKNSNFRCR